MVGIFIFDADQSNKGGTTGTLRGSSLCAMFIVALDGRFLLFDRGQRTCDGGNISVIRPPSI
jgi:hypothetical protein